MIKSFLLSINLNNLQFAVNAIIKQKLRSFLTALGIVFGIASVISMLAIVNGARQEIIEQLKYVGINNIIINPKNVVNGNRVNNNALSDKNNGKIESGTRTEPISSPFGLKLEDCHAIKNIIPGIKYAVPEITFSEKTFVKNRYKDANIVCTENEYFEVFNFKIQEGKFFNHNFDYNGNPVCIIGYGIKKYYFRNSNPIDSYIRCGNVWLKIIGVLEEQETSMGKNTIIESSGISSLNDNIYIPVKTGILRFNTNNSKSENANKELFPYNRQLTRITIHLKSSNHLARVSNIINKILLRTHNSNIDFEVIVPELLLKQQQQTKDIFNIVLSVIAGISLLVGGIGIMNVMFISVLERLKEIGIRLSLGATKEDIIIQFLAEAVINCVSGGLLGIILGIIMSQIISRITEVNTIITFSSIAYSFLIAVTIGLIFGFSPARKAAITSPIELLKK